MKSLLIIGIIVYCPIIIWISAPKIIEVIQLRKEMKHYHENFNAGHLDQIEIHLNHRYGNLAFIFVVSAVITVMAIAIIMMGDVPQ